MYHDVLIVGGGVAGSTLALQLLRRRPHLRVGLVDRARLPRPQSLSRLGESTTEAGAWYLGHHLGLEDHLRSHHLAKVGLRFFLRRPPSGRFESRLEYGANSALEGGLDPETGGTNPASWQVHRGVLEAEVLRRAVALGLVVLDEAELDGMEEGEPHQVWLCRAGAREAHQARWLVDASAGGTAVRAAFTSVVPSGHAVSATFGWTSGRVHPDRFSSHEDYAGRAPAGLRDRATSHIVGDGYWLWVINHRKAGASIGLMRLRDSPGFPVGGGLQGWLDQHEPELADEVRRAGGLLREHHGSFETGCVSELVSPRRLAVTGAAAASIDALYSSGFDLICAANRLLGSAIELDLDGGDLPRMCRYGSRLFPSLHQHYLALARDWYSLTRNPQAMASRLLWDNAVYFSFTAPWLCSEDFVDPSAFAEVSSVANRVADLHTSVMATSRTWGEMPPATWPVGSVDQSAVPVLREALLDLRTRRSGAALLEQLTRGLERLEQLGVSWFFDVGEALQLELSPPPWNPYMMDVAAARADPSHLCRGRRRLSPAPDGRMVSWLRP